MPDFEKMEQEADEELRRIYHQDPDDTGGVADDDEAAKAKTKAKEDTSQRNDPEKDTITQTPYDEKDGTKSPNEGTGNNSKKSEKRESVDLTVENAAERIKNAQALMTRATQEAAELRKQVLPIQDENKRLSSELEALRSEIAGLKSQQDKSDEKSGQEAAQSIPDELHAPVDEYPDVVGPVTKATIATAKKLDELKSAFEEKVSRVVGEVDMIKETFDEKDKAAQLEAHMREIRAAHPDVDDVAASQDFAGWLSRQSPFVQNAAQFGFASDVVTVLDMYKRSVGKITKLEEAREAASPATPRARKSPASSATMFTREQIMAMSADEFARNEAAIDEAMAAGLIK